jgi:predicted alpha/beta superfamily hydrolase
MTNKPPPVALPNSECRLFESSIVDDTFKLLISLPYDYEESNATYPVVYATDGGGAIFSLWNTADLMLLSGELPPLILVGISYDIDNPTDFWLKRQRDLDPFSDREDYVNFIEFLEIETIRPGGGDAFLHFIRDELKPFIDAEYRTIPNDSTYVGISSGGFFGLYAMFTNTKLFNRYIIGSPTLYRSNLEIFNYEREYADKHDDLAARVFLSVGGLEETEEPFGLIDPNHQFVTNFKKLVTTLENRKFPSLQLTSCIFENDTHLSVVPATYSRGLREVFRH